MTIGVYLKTGDPLHTPTNIFQVVGQAFHIASSAGETAWRKACDVVVEPDVGRFRWDDFGHVDELIRIGERAARRALPAIQALLQTGAPLAIPRPAPAR